MDVTEPICGGKHLRYVTVFQIYVTLLPLQLSCLVNSLIVQSGIFSEINYGAL